MGPITRRNDHIHPPKKNTGVKLGESNILSMSHGMKRKSTCALLVVDEVDGGDVRQEMSRSLTKVISTSSCASTGSETDSDCSRHTESAHKTGLNLSKTHHHLTGSFLFDDSPLPPLPNKPISSTKPLNERLINNHMKNQGPNVSMFYKADGGVVAVKGQGAIMYEPDGSSYLDCANNVAGCGHSHPLIVKAAVDEIQNIMTNGRFLHPLRDGYVQRLLATLPPELDTLYLVNSGSEANDLALRMAKQYSTSPNPDHVICLDSAYHGHVQSVVDVSPYKWWQCTDGNAKRYHKEHVHVVSVPDTYRGPYKTGAEYADEIRQVLEHTGGVGAFIHESILGCGGQIMMPDGYLPAAYDAVRSSGGCVIADEVQTGFGRAGTSFWQFQYYGVTPDIVTMGKPMGNGYPIGAVACRREVADRFAASGIEYFNTFGGNSVACAVGNAVLDAIERDGLQENARVVGEYLAMRMRSLQELPSVGGWVGDVRGHGLFQGIEFVKKRTELSGKVIMPHEKLCRYVVDFLKYERIIVSRDGPDGNVIKIKPPLVFTKGNADTLVHGMKQALFEAEKTGYF